MIPASSPKESASAVNRDHGNKDARARALSRADFARSGANTPDSFALARVENRAFTPASFAHAHACLGDKTFSDNLAFDSTQKKGTTSPPLKSWDDYRANLNATPALAPAHSSTYASQNVNDNNRAQEASNNMIDVMTTYGLGALAIGGVALGCASALGVGLVPLAVVASVLILGTVGAVALRDGAGSSPSPNRTGSSSGFGSSHKLDTPSSRGVSV